MQPPNKTPREAGKLAQGDFGFRHSEDALNIKETEPLQDNPSIVPLTVAGVYLCQRFHVRPIVADLVASLAGLSSERRVA
jgi:hypothetical protein